MILEKSFVAKVTFEALIIGNNNSHISEFSRFVAEIENV